MDLNDFIVDVNFYDHEALLVHKPCGKSFDMPIYGDREYTLKDIAYLAYDHECPKEE